MPVAEFLQILDLEITNRSLLAINSSLEAAKHKQAKEIRELRRRLRESRLVLPPKAYLAAQSEEGEEEADDEDDDDDDGSDLGKACEEDASFVRVKTMLDMLLQEGKKALETRTEDYIPANGGARVLHEEEARTWRLGERSLSTSLSASYRDSENGLSRSQTPSMSGADNAQDLRSEDEVEDLVVATL